MLYIGSSDKCECFKGDREIERNLMNDSNIAGCQWKRKGGRKEEREGVNKGERERRQRCYFMQNFAVDERYVVIDLLSKGRQRDTCNLRD